MKTVNTAITATISLLGFSLFAQAPVAKPSAEELTLTEPDRAAIDADRAHAVPPRGRAANGGGFGAGFDGAGPQWVEAAQRPPAAQVSVICFREPNQKELRETTGDVGVLALLLSRNLDQAESDDATDYTLGVPIRLANEKVGASYIQDFGALLKMQVRFPVAAPADGHVERKPAPAESEWETAKKEVQEQNSPDNYFTGASTFKKHAGESKPYDPALIQTLQKRILLLLKNASNIRHLKPDEWIIVKVVGAPGSSFVSRTAEDQLIDSETAEPKDGKKSARISANIAGLTHADAAINTQPTVLTLRVKKSDIDAFAAGSKSEEQFLKSAQVAAYFNPAPNDTDNRNFAFEEDKK
jgi:hypothetical protein